MTPEELNAYAEKAWNVGRALHGDNADSVKSIYCELIAGDGENEE